jgi:predicted small lipoprotein YifL
MRFRSFDALIVVLIAVGLGLSGCGQKGPLVPPKAQLSLALAPLR